MKPTNFPLGEANRGPKWKRGKKPQISIKNIGRIKAWDLHDGGADLEEIWIDLIVETVSGEWEISLVLDSPTQAEELITKIRAALAQKGARKPLLRLIRTTSEPHEKN